MIRHATIAAIVLCIIPSVVSAQTPQPTEFTIKVASADVRVSPNLASPVVGQAPRGAVLDVTRDIGAWVKVAWPAAPDGIGYVHQSAGTISHKSTLEERVAAAAPAIAASEAPTAQLATPVQTAPEVPRSLGTTYVAPPTHFVGVGARMSGTPLGGFGATARVWSRSRFGVQVEASRSSLTSTLAPGRMTSMQFAPSLIYSLPDQVTDYVWLRPYLGGGATFNRSTLKNATPELDASSTESNLAYRAFGGGEFTFPSVARFALSADLGYVTSHEPFAGFEVGGLTFSISGHFYVK
jgi:hypothetical protein